MKKENPNRIAIIGLPGSGKSTFAIKLGEVIGIPVHHLDRLQFDGKTKRDKEEFLSVKKALIKENAWIIEGCSISTLEDRFAHADTLIYLEFPRLLCMWRVCKRLLSFNKHHSQTGCLNGINWTLITYIWNFKKEKQKIIEELSKRYPRVDFLVFHRSEDLNDYLEKLKSQSSTEPAH